MQSNGFPRRETIERLRRQYPAGTRVALVHMDDPYTTLRPGDKGTVQWVDDAGGIQIAWDNGSTLAAIYPDDHIRTI